MKKVKLMLMSLSVLAVVGGALAFTAARTGATFCTALPDSHGSCVNIACPNVSKIKSPAPTDFICTSTTTAGGTDKCHSASGVAQPCGTPSVNSSFE